jgi:enoyl-CoA hydratase
LEWFEGQGKMMISVEQHEKVSVVRMQHGKVQAMDLEFCSALADKLDELSDAGTVATVLTGTGKVFSAGVDLKRLVAEPPDYVDEFFPALTRLFYSAWSFSGPLVTAINGHALAGGCVLANCGDWRVLAEGATIGMPESRVGLPLPVEGIEVIRGGVTTSLLNQVVCEGRSWNGNEAVTAGLADEVLSAETVLDKSIEKAARMAETNRQVFELGKRQIRQPVTNRILNDRESHNELVQDLWKSEEVRETVRRFVAERLG